MKQFTFSAQVANNLLTVLRGYSKTIRLLLVMFLTLTVTTNAWGADVTFATSAYNGKGGASGTGGNATATIDGVTITSTKAYYTSAHIREYSGGTITVSSSSNITKIVFTSTASGTNSNGPGKISLNSGGGSYSYSGTKGTWTGNGTSSTVTFNCNAQFRWTTIVVTIADAHTVTWTINPAAGGTLSATSGNSTTVSPNAAYTYGVPAYTVTSGKATVSQSGNTFTATPTEDCTIQINMEEKSKYTVTLDAGPGTCAASVTEASAGAGVTLPAPTLDGCDEWSFAGWKTTSAVTTETTTEPTLIPAGAYSPTSDITLYAVYQRTETTEGTPTTTNETYAHTIGAKTWSANGAQTLFNVSWTLTNDGNYYGYDGTKGQQVGSGSNPAKSMTLTTSGFSSATKITAVRISTSGASSINGTVSVKVGSTAYTSGGNTTKSLTTTNTEYEFTGSSTGNITISWSQTSSKAIYFKTIEVDYQTTTAGGGSTTYYHSTPDCGSTEPSQLATPTGLNVTNITSTSATLSWGEVANASSYVVTIVDGGAYSETFTTTSPSINITGLTAETDYLWTVQAIGDGTNYTDSGESEIGEFTTIFSGYTITYETKGGDAIAATSGTALPNPLPTPTRQHYTFVGWYTDESCTQAATAGATIDADITLYAKWTPKVYLTILHPQDGVLLDTNGTQQDSIIIEYVYGTSDVDIPVANYYQSITRDGYKFKGWYNNKNGGSRRINVSKINNQNFWAQWLEERTVTYYSIGQVYDTQTYGNGETLTLPTTVPTACDGYTFVGWTTSEQSETTTKPTLVSNTTVVSSDMNLYAVYKRTEEGGSAGSTETTVDVSIYNYATANSWEDATKYTTVTIDENITATASSNGANTGKYYNSGTNWRFYQTESSSLTISAATGCTINNVTITYSVSNTGVLKYSGSNVTSGKTVTVNASSVTFGVGNTGSATNGQVRITNISVTYITSNGTATTYTTSPNCCPVNLEKPQVTYSVADGAVTLNWTMVNNESDVADYTVACVGGETHTTTATSYTFTGLTNCAEYTFTVKANGDGTDVCSSGVTAVTATPAAGSFTVTFDYGAGEGTPTQWTSGCANGTSTTLPTPTTLPENHTFEGWYDGTNLYVAGDNYTPTSDVTLYARYTRNTAVDIVEWSPDAVTIEINTEGSAQVQIENEVEHGLGVGSAEELFFSKYYEASFNVKLVAIYNGTKNIIDLTDYTIQYGKTKWEDSYITLKDFGATKGQIQPGEEIILYSYTENNADDKKILDCVHEKFPDGNWVKVTSSNNDGKGTLSFGGDKTIILCKTEYDDEADEYYDNIIDVIGALIEDPNEGILPTSVNTKIPSWGDKEGWVCETGLSIADDSQIGISTNRCLLIRNNTVTSGDNAVANNIGDFVTLCSEWKGAQVPDNKIDNGVAASCENFTYVGIFDYSAYYVSYDSLTRVDLGGNKNADGTYTIPVPELDTLSCTKMRIQVLDNNGVSLASSEYKVPIMVKSSGVTTTDELFSKHGIEGCRDCDVVILKNATLQKAANGSANDMPEVRDMEVYAGGKLVVPNGTNYTMRKFVMRSKGDEVPVAEIDGTAVISDKLYHAKRIDAQKFYFFTLPYDCAVSDITYYNGEVLGARGIDYVIKYYDGAGRANGQNAGHWEEFTGATLQAGVGYILAVDASLNGDFNDNPKKEFLFPMTKTLTETSNKTVAVGTWGIGDATIGDNHKGWNLIGTPFMSHYNPISATGLKVGTYTDGEWNSEGTIFTYNESVTVPYVTMPNADGKTYTQRLASSQDLEPFKSFFIQVGKEGDVITDVAFSSAERLSKAPHRAPAVDATVWVELELKNTSGSDFTTIILDENCTADYEIGADLEKMLGYAALPQFYSLQSNARLAFNALPSEFASVSIPLGFYAPKSDTYTIALNTENTQNLEGVYLTDNVAGTVTNLLLDDYTFSSAKVLNETRFSIAVVRAVTAVDNVLAENDLVSIVNSYDLHIKNAPIGSELRVYDTLGREVISDQIDVEQKIYHLHTAGVYHVQIISKDKKSVYKVVSY